MDIKRLYEEQEVQWRQRLGEKEDEIANLRHDMEWRVQAAQQQAAANPAQGEEVARLKAENERLRADAQAKITQLQERIKELNQKLMAATPQAKR